MKTINLNRLIFLLFLSITIVSCSKEDDNDSGVNPGTTSKVSLIQQNYTIPASMDIINIPLNIEPKALKDGFVTVELIGSAVYNSDYTTLPAAVNGKVVIDIAINTQTSNLKIYRTNGNLTTEKTLNLKVSSPTSGFAIGVIDTAQVTFEADLISPNYINFNSSFGWISENEPDGMAIVLHTDTATQNGDFTRVKIHVPQGKVYGTHFYTVPSAVMNEISLAFAQNSQQTNFKIIPIDDHIISGNYDVVFEIIEANGSLEKGAINTFTATVVENDNQPAGEQTIAELKTNFSNNQNDWFFPTDYFIAGIVTSDGNVGDNKSIYIQDATSGILLRFNTPNIFHLGDKIKINLKNGTGKIVNGEKRIDDLNLSQAVKYGENIVVQPEVITIDQLYTGNYEGKRVKLVDVYFEDADGQMVFAGNHFIKQGNLSAVVTAYASAAFRDYILPGGLISVTGIVGNWNYILPQKYTHDIN